MNSKVVENCVKTINKARSLRGLNAFITETFELASKQAEESQQRHNNQGQSYFHIYLFIFQIHVFNLKRDVVEFGRLFDEYQR